MTYWFCVILNCFQNMAKHIQRKTCPRRTHRPSSEKSRSLVDYLQHRVFQKVLPCRAFDFSFIREARPPWCYICPFGCYFQFWRALLWSGNVVQMTNSRWNAVVAAPTILFDWQIHDCQNYSFHPKTATETSDTQLIGQNSLLHFQEQSHVEPGRDKTMNSTSPTGLSVAPVTKCWKSARTVNTVSMHFVFLSTYSSYLQFWSPLCQLMIPANSHLQSLQTENQ